MNEQLQQALTVILNEAVSAKDFLVAELPDIISQLLMWKLCYNALYCAIGATLVILSISFVRKSLNLCKAEPSYTQAFKGYSDVVIGVFLARTLAFIAGLCVLIPALEVVIQLQVAPKVYLIEYVAKLAN